MPDNNFQDEFDLLLEVGRSFLPHGDRVEQVQRSVIERQPANHDSAERIRAFLKRESLMDLERRLQSDEPQDQAIIDDFTTGDIDEVLLERFIGGTNDILSIETLEKGLEMSKSVGLIETEPAQVGTGFLVGEDIMMTNYHNIRDVAQALRSKFILDYEENDIGERQIRQPFELEPERFFFSNEEHDVALVAVKPRNRNGRLLSEYGSHRLFEEEGKIIIGQPVNIIQHPKGERKKVTMHNSILVEISNEVSDDRFCYYSADTLKGSSGSPVYNKHWEVIGLHRKGVPKVNEAGQIELKDGSFISRSELAANESQIKWLCNQGVRVSRIINCFKESAFENQDQLNVKNNLLNYWGVDFALMS